jgi:hypothetical protein
MPSGISKRKHTKKYTYFNSSFTNLYLKDNDNTSYLIFLFIFTASINLKIIEIMAEENNTTQNIPAELSETLEQLKTIVGKLPKAGAGEPIGPTALAALLDLLSLMEETFEDYSNTFTTRDRTRLVGGGIRNFGFIETAYKSAAANAKFRPPYLDIKEYEKVVQDFSFKRTLLTQVQQFEQQVADSMLMASDISYHFSLEYYNSVKEAAKQRIPGAEAEYNLLAKYFKKGKPSKDDSTPTEAQIERDVAGLLHGTKEGRIVIENENPDLSGGKRKVVDETHSEHAASQTVIKTDKKE